MHGPAVVARALELLESGMNQCEVGRVLGVHRRTIGDWANSRLPNFELRTPGHCSNCSYEGDNPSAYTYLLGLYLGDGHLSVAGHNVYRLRITCDDKYPLLLERCHSSMQAVATKNLVGRVFRTGCTDVSSYSKHWPCLFPQHGPGKKHDRRIELEPWQQRLVDLDPRPLVEGLLHSDGCRITNVAINSRTGKRYEYPRYHFSQKSDDIKRIFTDALDTLGVDWRVNNAMNISIARKDAVARLDSFVDRKE